MKDQVREEKQEETGRTADPCVMVIFGASGDLTKRKLIPALYNLAAEKLLSREFTVVGFARRPLNHDDFRKTISDEIREFATVPVDDNLWKDFAAHLYYQPGNFDDPEAYKKLKTLLEQLDKERGTKGNYFYYLAVGPENFLPIIEQLGKSGLTNEENGVWRRVIIEKPFGADLESAKTLNRKIRAILNEDQIYRIDHYLGKETVQNLLVFRFANGIFEPIWNRRYVDHVQITVAEKVGVEQRGPYYETSGALRDMIPNHIFQLISLTAMEPPISFEADMVRDEQAKLLRAIHPFSPEDVIQQTVRGQYGEGEIDGQDVVAYRSEQRVSPTSNTETFVAMKLFIDNWRWVDVPIYIRTGKRLASRETKIDIQFKRAPFMLFRKTAIERLSSNRLIIHIQPNEGISLSFGAKVPGPLLRLGKVKMEFEYQDYFGNKPTTGYERLLYDCMLGDATLFQRADMVEAGWSVVTSVLDVWKALPARNFPNYASGSWGPQEAHDLIEKDGRVWRNTD